MGVLDSVNKKPWRLFSDLNRYLIIGGDKEFANDCCGIIKEYIAFNEKNGADMSDIMDEVVGIFGSSMFSYESVPVALAAFYAAKGIGRDGVLAAINAGDDADTNGAICGNICGAYSGASSFPDEWKTRVQKTSSIDMEKLAEQLLG